MLEKKINFTGLVRQEHAASLAPATLTLRAPEGTEVVVKLGAAGVCHSDLHAKLGTWSTPLPSVLGHEGAGTVIAVGPAVTTVGIGDHVMLAWVAPCRQCQSCAAGQGWACEAGNTFDADDTARLPLTSAAEQTPTHSYLGVGSFAEYTLVSETAVVAIPTEVPFDVAAVMSCAVATGVGAVFNNADVKPGAKVVVIGAGGIGLSIVMASKLAAAGEIIAVDVSEEKLALATELGATTTVNASTEDPVARIFQTAPNGVDVAFDAAGKVPTMEQCIRVLARGGRCVLVGMPGEGARLEVDPLTISSMGLSIVGSNFGATVPLRDFPRLCSMYLNGQLPVDKLISSRIPLAGVEDAFEAMTRGDGARSVVVLG